MTTRPKNDRLIAAPTRRAALLSGLAAIVVPPARSAEATRLVLATATPGGGFPAFGAALVNALRATDPAVTIELRATGGSAENVGLLRDGSVDLALVQGEYAYPALSQPGGLSVLAPMYPTPGLFSVPVESPIRDVAGLRGRAVVLGTHNSGLTVMGRTVLAASGLDPERDIRPILLDRAGDGPTLVRDGRADALWGGGLDWPGFHALAQGPGGARFFGPPEIGIARLVQAGASLKRLTVAAGSFPGQDAPIETVGSWSLILARPGLDGEAPERLVRAIARADLGATHPKHLVGIVPAAWLNPATARFLQERGLAPR